jgi:plasmid stability protein
MVKITLSLDDETYMRVRIEAAKAGKSMSRWLADFIEAERRREEASEKDSIAARKDNDER